MKKFSTIFVGALSAMLLVGCSAPAESDSAVTEVEGAEVVTAPAGGEFSVDQVTSCDQVEAAVAPYIEGLVAADTNGVNEWGVECGWTTANPDENLAEMRSVQVSLTASQSVMDDEAKALMLEMGMEEVTDAWVTENGGNVMVMRMGEGGPLDIISTSVALPGVEAAITGGEWSNVPSLDGPAAAGVVKALFAG